MIIYKPENSPEYSIVDIVEFGGRKYRRYPNAKSESSRKYFVCGRRSLHRDVYSTHFGDIPDGWHVHHMDMNPLNNHPTNLEALPATEHLVEHGLSRTPEQLEHHCKVLAQHRHKAYGWHKTEEGRAWHEANRQAMREQRLSLPTKRHVCSVCDRPFESRSKADVLKYCSGRCRSAERKATGEDMDTRTCGHCGAEFSTWKYNKTACCSISCSRHLTTDRKHAGLNYDGTPREKAWKYKTVRNICDFCGEVYERSSRDPKSVFCSKSCAAKHRSMSEDKGVFAKCKECNLFFGTRKLKPESTCKSCRVSRKK